MRKASHKVKENRLSSNSTWSFLASDNLRTGLSRERIVETAVRLADAEGLEAISMRALAAKLKASPMALYHYVGSKADLLNLMRDKTFEEVKFDGPNPSSWRRVLKLWALRHKQNLERHKWLIFLPASQRQYGPEGTRLIEWCLEKLEDSGIGLREGTRYSETIYTFTLGFVSRESLNRLGRKERTSAPDLFSPQVLALGKFPRVAALLKMGIEPASDDAFFRSLEWILNGIATEMSTKT